MTSGSRDWHTYPVYSKDQTTHCGLMLISTQHQTNPNTEPNSRLNPETKRSLFGPSAWSDSHVHTQVCSHTLKDKQQSRGVWPPQGSSSTWVSVLSGPPPHYPQVFEVYRPAVPLPFFLQREHGWLFVACILHRRLWESPRSPLRLAKWAIGSFASVRIRGRERKDGLREFKSEPHEADKLI